MIFLNQFLFVLLLFDVFCQEELATVSRKAFDELFVVSKASNVALETLVSLHGQRVVKIAKQKTAEHKKKTGLFVQLFRNKRSLLEIAVKYGAAPCMLARMAIGAELNLDRGEVSKMMKQASLLPERLQREVLECMRADQVYSPFVERLKEHVGSEWEFHLSQRLCGLQFKTEDEMRADVREERKGGFFFLFF
jgi:hypothetical protein